MTRQKRIVSGIAILVALVVKRICESGPDIQRIALTMCAGIAGLSLALLLEKPFLAVCKQLIVACLYPVYLYSKFSKRNTVAR